MTVMHSRLLVDPALLAQRDLHRSPTISSTVPFLVGSSGLSFSAFDFAYLHRPEDSPSAFYLLLHGNSKLQNAKQGSSGPPCDLRSDFRECFRRHFRVPENVQNPASSLTLPGPSLQSTPYPLQPHPPSLAERGMNDGLREQRPTSLDRSDGDAAESHPNLSSFGTPHSSLMLNTRP